MRPQQSETPTLVDSRLAIRDYYLADEHKVVHEMIAGAQLSPSEREAISARAADLVRSVGKNAKPTIMEKFLAGYGLTTKEGVGLMCLARSPVAGSRRHDHQRPDRRRDYFRRLGYPPG